MRPGVPVLCAGSECSGWHEAGVLQGASLLIRTAVFEDVGLLEENYLHYIEERYLVAPRVFTDRSLDWRAVQA